MKKLLIALFCISLIIAGSSDVKVYKLHKNYSMLFDEDAILVPAQAKIMFKSPDKVEGATTLKKLYKDGWNLDKVITADRGMDEVYFLMTKKLVETTQNNDD
ncbi:hypothetical protein HOE22_05965 [Candidatus Woesearchaeota archaeon]|nr:hypothetical protein [Candidatus Woesearchaeota archaeon]MBT5991933.1 hypothetical protein [Bacteroidota bacterium]